jgi:4-amino-4-deoxy-L-arabinose transferase-like glycosyltransferase
MQHIIGWITDAKNRPEIKAVLGILSIIVAFVVSLIWLFVMNVRPGVVTEALLIFGTFFGGGLGLLGIQAIADAKIDKQSDSTPVTINVSDSNKVG